MKPIKFEEAIIINSAAEYIFDYTQDYNKRLNWDSFLKKAELIDGAKNAAKGVRAYCVSKNGLGMVTEYITFDRPGTTAIKMTEGPFMFRSFLGSWRFKAAASGQTEVIFLYLFSLQFPFNLFAGLIKRNLQKNVKQRLEDLKATIESSILITGKK